MIGRGPLGWLCVFGVHAWRRESMYGWRGGPTWLRCRRCRAFKEG